MTARTKDETIRDAAGHYLSWLSRGHPEQAGPAQVLYAVEAMAYVLEAVGFFRLEEQRDELLEACASADAGISDWRLGSEFLDGDGVLHMSASVDYLRSVQGELRSAIAKAEGR